MTAKPIYKPIDESILRSAWERMQLARVKSDDATYNQARSELLGCLDVIGTGAPALTNKYRELLDQAL